jgi:hypothetical protein
LKIGETAANTRDASQQFGRRMQNIRAWMVRLLAVNAVVLTMSTPALAEFNAEDLNRVQQAVARVWPKMDQIWPGADFSKLTLLLLDDSSAVEITATNSTPLEYEVALKSFPSGPSGGFKLLSWKGSPAVAVRVNALPLVNYSVAGMLVPYVFALATHEAFHAYVQSTAAWSKATFSSALRAARYPVETTPRLYRYLTFKSLFEAYQNLETPADQLAIAAGWYQRWKNEFADEAKESQYTDLIEGTAQYAMTLATARAAVGFEVSDAQWRAALLEVVKANGSAPQTFISPDNESYPLGTVAGLIADQTHPNWKQEVQQGSMPLEVLFQESTSSEQPVPAEVATQVETVMAARQTAAATLLEPFLDRFQNRENTLLVVPLTAISGSYLTLGFYQTPDVVYKPIVAAISTVFLLASGTLNVIGVTGAFGYLSACAANGVSLILVLAPGEVSFSDDRVTFNGNGLSGTFSISRMNEADRNVLCAK